MRSLLKSLLVMPLLAMTAVVEAGTCKGKFPNYISDVCWSCAFPLRIAGIPIMGGKNEDTENPGGPVCACANGAKIGIPVSFWEPARTVDITKEPWCMVSLGGFKMDIGFNVPQPASHNNDDDATKSAIYHSHWYITPLMWILEVMFDNACIEQNSFDVAYLTEVDPTWHDNELQLILNPDAVMFATPVAQIACAADAVAANTGFPLSELFWCAGSQGNLYPLGGDMVHYGFGVAASMLTVQRMTAKMHREGLMWGTWGENGMCGYYPQVMMDKRAYKSTMIYPIPQTEKTLGHCCQPYGRTTALWGAGKHYPVEGEDFAYILFRKRNCCQGAFSLKDVF